MTNLEQRSTKIINIKKLSLETISNDGFRFSLSIIDFFMLFLIIDVLQPIEKLMSKFRKEYGIKMVSQPNFGFYFEATVFIITFFLFTSIFMFF